MSLSAVATVTGDAQAQCSCPKRFWRELSPEDAATLRLLDAARKSTTGQRALRFDVSPAQHSRRTMIQIAHSLERLAADGVIDPERLAGMAGWLRDNLPVVPPTPDKAPRVSDGRAVLHAWVRAASNAGYTLESIAYVMGVTRERVRQIAAQTLPVDNADVPPVIGVPRPVEDLPWPTVLDKKWLAWPRPTLSPEEAAELIELQRLGTQLRGNCPAHDPRRLASEELVRRINILVTKRGFTIREVGETLGLTQSAIKMKLGKHGYRSLPPSQKPYLGSRAG
jgi:hypothetical protein